MHKVVERIYMMYGTIDTLTSYPMNNKSGIGFARELKRQLEKRFPDKGTKDKLPCMANYLAPQFKGMHLEEENKFETRKQDIERESKKINEDFEIPIDDLSTEPERETPAEFVELSPTSKLRARILKKKFTQQKTKPNSAETNCLPFRRKCQHMKNTLALLKKMSIFSAGGEITRKYCQI